jgi:hypothetical protein
MQLGAYSIRLVLVFGLLLTGVPAWEHSHNAGNRPHSHARATGHARASGHAHRHASEHAPDGVGESQPHLHVALFGVEFTIPVESESELSWRGETTFLMAASVVVDLTPTASHFAALAQPMLEVGEPVQIVPTFRCISAVAAPLSDNARHERSGVLLI